MRQIAEVFTPFIDQPIWQVRRGHGSFLIMEFGAPHLIVREPITPRADASGKVKRNLLGRRVEVTGDWHLWIQYGDWRLSPSNDMLTSIESPGSQLDECLRDLEGQRFVSVGHGTRPGS